VRFRPAAQDDDWDAFDGGAGGSDAGEAGPSAAPLRPGAAKKKKPALVWREDPEVERQNEQTRLAEQYIGSRVCYRGYVGTVKGIEADMEDVFRFNVRFDNDSFGDIALCDIKDAVAAAAAAGHFPAAVPAVPARLQAPAEPVEVIVIDDDGDDAVVPPAQEARPGSEATPAPAAPAPRRNARKSSQPTKRGRASPGDAAAPDEAGEHAAAAPPAKLARRSLNDASAPPDVLDVDVADDTQATPPVLELSALPMMALAKLVRQITLKLTCGEGPVGKLGQDDVQRLLGHSRVETTMIYNHVAAPVEKRISSPLDRLEGGG
jgi:hypothetical protein